MTRRSTTTTVVVVAAVVAALLVIVLVVRARATATARCEAGSALFHGEALLAGSLVGQSRSLPTIATRCSNCHEAAVARNDRLATVASDLTRLRGAALSQPRARRGGPPSVYDAAALCTLLRTGIDPAHVVVPAVMPRYRASDAECVALWAYLVSL